MARVSTFCMLFLTVLTAAAAGADWPHWRGPGRCGVAPNCPPLVDSVPAKQGPKLLWEETHLRCYDLCKP